MKLCILVEYNFLIKKRKFGVSQCISGHVISKKVGIYTISHISAIFKDRDFWLGPKYYIKFCAEQFATPRVIKHISCHVTGYELIG